MLIHPVNQNDHEQTTLKQPLRYEENWKYPTSPMKR